MGRQCPPGVLCIENVTLTIVSIIFIFVMVFLHFNNKRFGSYGSKEKIIINNNIPPSQIINDDILSNPYQPPLQINDLYMMRPAVGLGMPINIPTQGYFRGGGGMNSSFQQVGILTRLNGVEMILPLMGRLLLTNRDKWNFYTISDGNNMVKLPIIANGRGCMQEYGCDNLSSGDKVKVEGYNDFFKVTIYDNQGMQYLPIM
jgi:hypothetical protein